MGSGAPRPPIGGFFCPLNANWRVTLIAYTSELTASSSAIRRWKSALRDAREADAKATAIENAVYDLKAVNPHRVVEEDRRTPLEIIKAIEQKGKEADLALSKLNALLNC